MALSLRRSNAARDAFGELAELWIGGLSANHDASCACAGLFEPVDARSIEADFCAILADRYRRETLRELIELLERRAARRDDAPFERWIDSLRDAGLSEPAQTRLVADLRVFLESFAGHGRPRIGVCY